MVFSHAEQHEKLGVFPIRATKLPKRATQGVDPTSRHVHTAKATMRRIVGGSKTLCPKAGEALRLIATGKKG